MAVTAVTADPTGAATQTSPSAGPSPTTARASRPSQRARAAGWTRSICPTQPTLTTPGANVWTLGSYERGQRPGGRAELHQHADRPAEPGGARPLRDRRDQRSATTPTRQQHRQHHDDVTGARPGPAGHQRDPCRPASTAARRDDHLHRHQRRAGADLGRHAVLDRRRLSVARQHVHRQSRATLLGTVQHANTGLAAGASYTESLTATAAARASAAHSTSTSSSTRRAPRAGHAAAPAATTRVRWAVLRHEPTRTRRQPGLGAAPVVYAEADLAGHATSPCRPDRRRQHGHGQLHRHQCRQPRHPAVGWTDRSSCRLDASLDNERRPADAAAAGWQLRGRGRTSHDGVLAAGRSPTPRTITLHRAVRGQRAVQSARRHRQRLRRQRLLPEQPISPRLQGIAGNAAGVGAGIPGRGQQRHRAAGRPWPPTPRRTWWSARLPRRRGSPLGSTFDVSYTVTNQGGATPIQQSAWDDLVYLSVDDVPGPQRRPLHRQRSTTPAGWRRAAATATR